MSLGLMIICWVCVFFFSSRRRHTRCSRDWSSDVCSSDLSLMYMPNTLPAVSLTTQRRLLHVEDSILMTFPEVASVWGKAGRAETPPHRGPVSNVGNVANPMAKSPWGRGMAHKHPDPGMGQQLR